MGEIFRLVIVKIEITLKIQKLEIHQFIVKNGMALGRKVGKD